MEHDAPRGVMSHIEVHPNPKTNLKTKTNPNSNLENTFKKTDENRAYCNKRYLNFITVNTHR